MAAVYMSGLQLLSKISDADPHNKIQLMDLDQMNQVLADTCAEVAAAQKDRPEPVDVEALQQLAVETRKEAESQRSIAEQLCAQCGAPSDYEESALEGAIDAIESSLHQSIQQAELLQQQLGSDVGQDLGPSSLADSVEACGASNIEAQEALDRINTITDQHQSEMDQLWKAVRMAQSQAESPLKSPISNKPKSKNEAIVRARTLAGVKPND